jgi:hypothetical protein
MKKIRVLIKCACLITIFPATAQTIKVPPSIERWNVEWATASIESYQNQESILLKSGAILLKDVELLDGVIEVDISFPQQRSFPGFALRVQDINNFENFYVRPHQSGNPDATQYTPVFNGHAGWQLYHGEGYSKAFTFQFNTWHHIKIVLHGLQAEIFIDDMEKPLIKVQELKGAWKAGKIGLISGGAPIHFANFQYTIKDGTSPTRIPVPANGTGGVVTEWHVSNVVNRSLFENKFQLTPEIKNRLNWNVQHSEPSGTINLAKFIQPTDTNRTMVVKLNIESELEQVKRLSFGFSDYVTIYLNNKPIYQGSDNFMSRDYRFLGTIGFFDMVFLPLKKGLNELWFVVSEDFGGWGLKAKFDNMEKISLK